MKNPELIEKENKSLSHIIAEKITEQILTGELKPGEKIVEKEYADEFAISRAPIREALYLLTHEGLVERVPRKGSIVKGYTDSEIYDLIEVRIFLEMLAIKRIKALGVNNALIEKMENLIPLMKDAHHDNKKYAQLNYDFHHHIIEMSHSEVIMSMYSRLGMPLLSLQRISFLEEQNINKSIEEHQQIIWELKNGEIEEARKILQRHNEELLVRIESTLTQKGENK